tara:strand:+ start:19139 stop:19288 length:150 start_codon:yes stop_codon:yes gene_type:complete
MADYKQYAVTKTKDGVTKTIYTMGEEFPAGSAEEIAEQAKIDQMIEEQL